ncbi:MAG TPA: glycosyltransferase family 4 protein [Gaiellales bacterium]|nr:glycosyltransferase family 4 protein [Gaiellales bacterium]
MKPVALVTGVVSDHRVEPFRILSERENVELLSWQEPRRHSQLEAARLAGSGRYRAVIGGLGGRVALPAAYLAARRARIPFVLWASLWAHPRTAAHAASFLPLRAIYRHADAVVTYGPHVTRYVERFRDAGNVFEAPQAVDPAVFGRIVSDEERRAARQRMGASADGFLALFVGRLVPEKGIDTLLEAWRRSSLPAGSALAFAGAGPLTPRGPGVRLLGRIGRDDLPPLYSAADVLVLPSIATATFREPWGLVSNEAMHQSTPVIASDAVGAAAGGLVVDGRTGMVFPAGDADALAARLTALAAAPDLRASLGEKAHTKVADYTPARWADGMSRALAAVGASVV